MSLKIVTANRLRDGSVVYLAGSSRWSERLRDARRATDEAEADALLDAGERAVAAQEVVAPYLIDVVQADGTIHPVGTREIIRASRGPTIKPPVGSFREEERRV